MSIATTITVDDHFARIQLSHGLIVAAAVEGLDQLIVLVPRSGGIKVVRVEWPTIRSAEIIQGTFCITDADSVVTMADLHSHLLSGSLGDGLLTREELTSRVSTKRKPIRKILGNHVASESPQFLHVDELQAGFGLANRWTITSPDISDDPQLSPSDFRSIKFEAFTTAPTQTVLLVRGVTHGRGHVHIDHPLGGNVTFSIGAISSDNCYFVTGPQRSGSTFLAHAISFDLGIQHIDEVDFQTFDYAQFREVAARSRCWVAQAPALFHHLTDVLKDFPSVIPVVCRRSVEDIIASQRRINWGAREEGFERHHLAIPKTDQRPIAEIKYEMWDANKSGYKNFIDVNYDELRKHPLFAEERSNFGPKRWS
jgi:hypothetical protein